MNNESVIKRNKEETLMEETTLKPRGFMQKLAAYTPKKKPGAVLSLETMLYIALIIIFVAVGIGIFSQRESAKVAACNQELDQIRTALVQYSSLRMEDNNDISDLTILFDAEAIKDTESVDGIAHGYFLQQTGRWKDGQLHNPWGDGFYTYDASSGVISTEHDGKTFQITVGALGT